MALVDICSVDNGRWPYRHKMTNLITSDHNLDELSMFQASAEVTWNRVKAGKLKKINVVGWFL